ncbi:MAG: hypothetical protein SNH55_05055 [Rikenellaceae bacterium]
MTDILKSYQWYLPVYISSWRSCKGEGVDGVTELVVMNRPEAVVEHEEVDMEFLMSLVEEPAPAPAPKRPARPSSKPVVDAIAALEMMQPQPEVKKGKLSMGLIDKFLEVKDLRITPQSDDDGEVVDLMWERSDPNQPNTAEDDVASEELAAIYLKQRLYKEASDIYNRLFLLYSEKSVYFASQIEKIDKILEEKGE